MLEPGEPGEGLWWWGGVGAGWHMPIGAPSVVVTLPAEPLRAECVLGDDVPCTASVEGTSLRVTTGPLEPFTPVTVRVAFDADDVAAPIPAAADSDLWWSLVAGLGNGFGTAFLYRGLSAGRMGVVAPISGVGAALVPVVPSSPLPPGKFVT